jgi:beta-mannanase
VTPIPAPEPGTIWFGAAPVDHLSALTNFEAAAGHRPALFQYYNAWKDQNGLELPFDTGKANEIHDLGMTPIVSWEPWDTSIREYDGPLTIQPLYELSTITSGDHDCYIEAWARDVQAWGHPLFLRFAHEMNGDWYPWAQAVNGNDLGEYKAAWRYVHDKFACLGVTNVTWVWAPNVWYDGSTGLRKLYPGDDYVDWIGVDGYNFGSTRDSGWRTFDEVFDATLDRLTLFGKPLMLTETASTEDGGDKAGWIDDFFSQLDQRQTVIRGFVWFNIITTTDWRIESSPEATTAFHTGIVALDSGTGTLALAPAVL